MNYLTTPNNTNRLFLHRDEMPENQTQFGMLQMFLGTLSIWGNFDSNTELYLSWEFPMEITEEIIVQSLNRLGCKLHKTSAGI